MSSRNCEFWQGDMALAAIGRLATQERLNLDAHLSECPDCRAEMDELGSVSRALESADPMQVDPSFGRSPGTEAVSRPNPERPVARRTRLHLRWVLGSLAAAAVAGLSLFWLGPFASSNVAVTLHGTAGVQASAVLSSERWGTELSLQVAGQPAGQLYRVSMESRNGAWWQAGSYRSEAGPVHVQLACAISPSRVERIWIESSSGRTVLEASLG